MPPDVRVNLDVFVPHPVLTEHERRKIYDDFFRGPYDRLVNFTAAHRREAAHDARLVYSINDVVARSLTVAKDVDRAPFTLRPANQARALSDMSIEERQAHVDSIRAGTDIALTPSQAVELFRASGRVLHDFSRSRHYAYLVWLTHVHAELLAITETSCGHLPRVLCDLIVEYLLR